MSVLIAMRHRMKAVETIKKITHAMQLISMSTHARLRTKKTYLEEYQQNLTHIFTIAHAQLPTWHDHILSPDENGPVLAILVGSQKGLCGNFNQQLYFNAEKQLAALTDKPLYIITVGKKMRELATITHGKLIQSFDTFSSATLNEICTELNAKIRNAPTPYSKIIIFSNYPKTFFSQKPETTQLIPFAKSAASSIVAPVHVEQPLQEIVTALATQLMRTKLQETLFLSLIAEQASRFIAMDSSTRNASDLLVTMRLNYNKLRQSKITRELTDLAGSFF